MEFNFQFEVLHKVETDLTLDEKVSLVFLLYDDVRVALEIISLTLHAHKMNPNKFLQTNVLYDWARVNMTAWREKMVEGLLIIGAYSNIKKMDLDLRRLIQHFQPNCVQKSQFIHPLKKALYSVCESLVQEETQIVVVTILRDFHNLQPDKHDTLYLEYCLLRLFLHGYIQLGSWRNNIGCIYPSEKNELSDIKKFVNILKALNLTTNCNDLLSIEEQLNISLKLAHSADIQRVNNKSLPFTNNSDPIASTSRPAMTEDNTHPLTVVSDELFEMNLNESEPSSNRLIAYEMSSTPLGYFVIINQVKFKNQKYPELVKDLDERIGSNADVERLTKTWTSLGFKVVCVNDNNHQNTILHIKMTISISKELSAYALCILSHGEKGAVFAADGVKITIEEIEDLLSSKNAPHLVGKPKLLLIQACQGEAKLPLCENKTESNLRTDGPNNSKVPQKSDILVFWSTVPNYASYRDRVRGTWFIQSLCDHLDKQKEEFSFTDLCILVNNDISNKTDDTLGDFGQMSEYTTCFTKLLYLKNNSSL